MDRRCTGCPGVILQSGIVGLLIAHARAGLSVSGPRLGQALILAYGPMRAGLVLAKTAGDRAIDFGATLTTSRVHYLMRGMSRPHG